jgi:hypothetical protein
MTLLGRVRTVFTGVAGTPWYSNIYFDADAAVGPDYIPFVADFWNAMDPYIMAVVQWAVEPEVAIVDDNTGEIVDVGTGAGVTGAGAATGEALPWACQGLINWHTGEYIGGRQLRGKTYVPGISQVANDNGVLLAGAVTTFLAAAAELISDGNGALRVFSPTHLTSEPVIRATVPRKIAVLRSRRD